jgi:hypothetical protein
VLTTRRPGLLALCLLVLPASLGCGVDDGAEMGTLSCAALDNQPGNEPVTVRIENARSDDVFLLSPVVCGRVGDPENNGPMGAPPIIRIDTFFPESIEGRAPAFGTWPGTPCDATCADARDGEGYLCEEGCGTVAPIRLIPGGVYEDTWPGIIRTRAWLPDECRPAHGPLGPGDPPPKEGPCQIELTAIQGSYVARAEEVFLDSSHSLERACAPNSDGWCYTDAVGASPGQAVYTIFEYPSLVVRLILD